jgi:hypothetical protein
MKISSWTMTPESLAAFATQNCHITLNFLKDRGFLTEEEYQQLTATIIVTAIENNKSFGKQILKRFFNKEESKGEYTFTIAELPLSRDKG